MTSNLRLLKDNDRIVLALRRMASNTRTWEVVARDLSELTSIQMDEEHHLIYALTNDRLARIDLHKKSDENSRVVYQHNRKFGEGDATNNVDDDDDDMYSQGQSDDEERVSNPFEDSESSTDDDEQKITDRRNWRRYGWRTYRLDNPCSILFLKETNQVIVLNEGVITFLKIELENDRAFVQGQSQNIFCYDFDVFNKHIPRISVQPWSIAPTSISGFFLFSLLQGSHLYSLDLRNGNTLIEEFMTTGGTYCQFLRFHSQSNDMFLYDSTQVSVLSLDRKTMIKIDLPFIEQRKTISNIAIDMTGYLYILVDWTIFKCSWQKSQLQCVECLGQVEKMTGDAQMIVDNQGKDVYISNMNAGCIYRSQL